MVLSAPNSASVHTGCRLHSGCETAQQTLIWAWTRWSFRFQERMSTLSVYSLTDKAACTVSRDTHVSDVLCKHALTRRGQAGPSRPEHSFVTVICDGVPPQSSAQAGGQHCNPAPAPQGG